MLFLEVVNVLKLYRKSKHLGPKAVSLVKRSVIHCPYLRGSKLLLYIATMVHNPTNTTTYFHFDMVGPETVWMVRNEARLFSLGGAFLGRLPGLMG